MKHIRLISILFFFSICACNVSGQKSRSIKNPFFVFNNGFNKQGLDFIPYDDQARFLKKYGFQGIEHRETKGILELKEALKKEGLNMYADYLQIDIEKPEPYLPDWKTVIPQLKGTGLILWVHIHSAIYKPSDETADEIGRAHV